MAAFRAPELVERTLGAMLDGTIPQEAIGGVLGQLLASHHGRRAAWRFLRDRWEDIRPRVGDMGISRVVEALGRLPGDERAEVVGFFDQKPPQGAERALARALAGMDQYEELRARATGALVSAITA